MRAATRFAIIVLLVALILILWSWWESEQQNACLDRELAREAHYPFVNCLGD